MALISTSRLEKFLSLDNVLSKLKWTPSILIQPVTSEISLQFPGLFPLYFDLPNQHTSHFSMFVLRLENTSKFAISFRILFKDCLSWTKKVVSSANAASLMTRSPILNPLIDLSSLTWMNKTSRAKIWRQRVPLFCSTTKVKISCWKSVVHNTTLCIKNNSLIHFMKSGPKPSFTNVAKRKLCSNESNAYSISAAKSMPSKFSSYAWSIRSPISLTDLPIFLPCM